jgi:hypothetical protein
MTAIVKAGQESYFPSLHAIPGIKDETGSPVLTELPALIVLEDAEGLRWVIVPHDIRRVEQVAQIVSSKAITRLGFYPLSRAR